MIPAGAVPSLIACLSYAYFAAFALSLDRKSATVRLFVLVEVFFFIWSGGAVGILLSGTPRNGMAVWERVTYLGAGMYAVAGFFLFKSISGYRFWPDEPKILAAALVPALLVQTANLGWNAVAAQFPAGPFHIAHHAVTNAYNAAGLVLIVAWGLGSGLRRERRQASLIVVATLSGIPLGLVLDFLLGRKGIPSQANLVPAAWSAVIFFAIAHYGLFRDSASSADLATLFLSEEAVLVFDPPMRSVAGNKAMERLLGMKSLDRLSMDSLFTKGPRIRNTIQALFRSRGDSFETNDLLRLSKGGFMMSKLHFTLLKDRWSDPLKIVCFVRPVPRAVKIATDFALSRREQEIMGFILSGASQQAIGDSLCISLATVKTHTANLYNKLGIASRTELFALMGSEEWRNVGADHVTETAGRRRHRRSGPHCRR